MNEQKRRLSSETLLNLVILAVVFAVFARTLQAGFVYWDDNIVYDNPHIRGLDWVRIRWMFTDFQYLWRYMPLTWLGWAVTYELFGLNPFGFHLGNLVLHGANAMLVFLLLRKLYLGRRKDWTAEERKPVLVCCVLGALLWAIHPLRVEPVAWVTDRVYGQSALFLLLSLLCYLQFCNPANPKRRRFYWYSVGAFGASLLSYQTGLGYVLVLAVLDAYPLRRFTQGKGWWHDATARRIWLEKIPFATAAAVVVVLTLLARFQAAGGRNPVSLAEFGMAERAMQAFYIWAYYLWRPWFPVNLSPYYTTLLSVQPAAPQFIASAVLVFGLSALLVFQRHRWPWAWTLWACHLILLVPVLGLTEHPHYPSDRYSFLVSITWSILLTAGLIKCHEVPRLRFLAPAVAAVLICVLGMMSYRQTGIWQNSVVLHRHMIQLLGDHPNRAGLYCRLGNVYLEMGDDQQAADAFRQVLQIEPGIDEAHERLGEILHRQGKFDDAIDHYTAALRITPDDFLSHHNLGAAFAAQGKMTEAAAQFAEAVRLNPQSVNARRNMARALSSLGRLDEAKTHELEAQRLENQQREAAR